MKNVFVIFILFTCMLQSCTDNPKTPTVDFNNATFLSEQDILKAIQLYEIFLDSELQKNSSGALAVPPQNSDASSKKLSGQEAYAQSNEDFGCGGFIPEYLCLKGRGKINNDCIPKGPCVGIRNLEWLIIYYRNVDFLKKQQISLINLSTGEPIVPTESKTDQQLPYTYFSVKSSIENKEQLGIQYSADGVMKNIPVTY